MDVWAEAMFVAMVNDDLDRLEAALDLVEADG